MAGDFTPDYPPEYMAAMKREHWADRTLLDQFEAAVAVYPERLAVADHRHATGERNAFTYAELAERVDAIAAGLLRRDVRPGDVVSIQLPNWWQLPALHLACLRVGAITNAVMSIFRRRELEFMLGLAGSRVLVVPQEFNGFDHATLARGLQRDLQALEQVIVVGGDGPDAFEALASTPAADDDRREFTRRRPSPDDVMQLVYTSGTTGEPKGAMTTSNALLCNVRDFAGRLGLTSDDVVLMASPLTHQTGFMYGFMVPVVLGASFVLQDVWRPERAAHIVETERATFTMASTPFLADLTAQAERTPEAFASLRLFLCAGAPVPRELVRRATDRLGARITSGWGMTEMGAVTITGPDDPPERVFETDGAPLPGVDIRVLDLSGGVAGPDEEGRLQVRANSLFGGYLKRPALKNLDPDGWFDTGDLARIDADGYLRITGRSKDIIIRGGENVPVVEIEGLLFDHPDVAELAIVAMPDERLGERACAFVVPREGTSPTLEELCAFLAERGTARNYLPERLELVDALPRTLTGKVQKFKLREQAAAFGLRAR